MDKVLKTEIDSELYKFVKEKVERLKYTDIDILVDTYTPELINICKKHGIYLLRK